MNIKLVALDLDGTLLDCKKRLSERNRQAMEACIEKGIWIVPATGRTISGIPDEIRTMDGIRYAITLNGGVLLDLQQSCPVDARKLDYKVALEIMEVARRFHVMYDAHVDGIGISENRFYHHMDEYGIPKIVQKLIQSTRKTVSDIEEHIRLGGIPVEKVNLYFRSVEERQRVRQFLSERKDIIISSSLENNLEINAIGATKGEALVRLADHLGLRLEETMACGDGENDLTLIRTAGIGVVMANGEDALKELADYVTESNDNDGVAKAIEKFALVTK